MANILDGISGASILDGLAEWPASTTRKSGSPSLVRIQETIADMVLDPAALAEVEAAFIELACFDPQTRYCQREETAARMGGTADRRRNGSQRINAFTAETWGCSHARDVVAAAHKDSLDACYGSKEIDQRDLLFQQVGCQSASPARLKMQVSQRQSAPLLR